jgi:hypothetical protein
MRTSARHFKQRHVTISLTSGNDDPRFHRRTGAGRREGEQTDALTFLGRVRPSSAASLVAYDTGGAPR